MKNNRVPGLEEEIQLHYQFIDSEYDTPSQLLGVNNSRNPQPAQAIELESPNALFDADCLSYLADPVCAEYAQRLANAIPTDALFETLEEIAHISNPRIALAGLVAQTQENPGYFNLPHELDSLIGLFSDYAPPHVGPQELDFSNPAYAQRWNIEEEE